MLIPRRRLLKNSLACAAGYWLIDSRRGAQAQGAAAEVPWLADVQTAPAALPEKAPKLSPLLRDAAGEPIRTLDAWKKRRVEIVSAWEAFLGPLALKPLPVKLEVIEEDRPEGCIRQLVRYEVELGIHDEGYLIKPARVTGKVPGVVALHSTYEHTIRQPAGVQGQPEKAFGLKLAQRGMITFSPRNFLWHGGKKYLENVSDFQQRHPKCKGMAKMLWDARRAVDVLLSLPEVDATRLGSVGHSLGGKEVLYLAAFDERVKVHVSSEGGIGTRFSNWDAVWYLSDAIKNGGFDREHHELVALAAPRPFLLLGGDSADGTMSWPFIDAVLPVYRLYGGTPRVGLFNHKKGHAVPPEAEARIYQWLETYLA